MRQRGTSALTLSISFRTSEKSARGVVVGGGQDAVAVGHKHCADDKVRVALQGGKRLAVAVPQLRCVHRGSQDAAAVGRERRGDRNVVALRRAPFAPGMIFWQPPFRLAAQICKVLRRPPRRLPFQRATDEICTPRLAGALPREIPHSRLTTRPSSLTRKLNRRDLLRPIKTSLASL